MSSQKSGKTRDYWSLLPLFINTFFFIFLMWYIGNFGLSNFILVGEEKRIIILNITIWYTLIMFNLHEFFEYLDKYRGTYKK